ncbi:MAG: outer membrane lipoprotein carrier protein LolA [Proteobacteria bacterium]|nr:outer membrane lipoprotein carrier protein LolA [Pseudomonadota bacterium]
MFLRSTQILSLLICLFYSLCLALSASAAGAEPTLTDVEKYLNGITTIQADFKQTAVDGATRTGVVYIQKPGKLRWEYLHPTNILIIGNKKDFSYYDADLDEVSYISSDSALGTFLTQEIRFNQTIKVRQYSLANGKMHLSLHDPKDEMNTEIVMHFNQAPLKLLGFSLIEDGQPTATIEFSKLQTGNKLNEDLFDFRNPKFFR